MNVNYQCGELGVKERVFEDLDIDIVADNSRSGAGASMQQRKEITVAQLLSDYDPYTWWIKGKIMRQIGDQRCDVCDMNELRVCERE